MEADRRPSLNALILMAISYDALGASDRAEKHYREAMRVAPASATPRFNLSLLLERQGRTDEAEQLAGEAVNRFPSDGVYRGWRAILWKKQGREAEAKEELRRAAEDLDALPSLDRWERHWRTRIAEELGDNATVARLEREANKPESAAPAYDKSRLPGHAGILARRAS
jgi:tetratricopeptide (TPR) repeat protein